METRIKCFWAEPTNRVSLSLRRYVSGLHNCPGLYRYHNASVPIGEAEAIFNTAADAREGTLGSRPEQVPHDDPRWPPQCGCGYAFQDHDEWQLNQDLIYQRADNQALHPLRDLPVGAMFFADWHLTEGSLRWRGPDGHCLMVRLPGRDDSSYHDWIVDGICNNCDRPHDLVHKCWVRHGDPRTGIVTVDKQGLTCSAGAGSIITPNWHGFLREGWLEKC